MTDRALTKPKAAIFSLDGDKSVDLPRISKTTDVRGRQTVVHAYDNALIYTGDVYHFHQHIQNDIGATPYPNTSAFRSGEAQQGRYIEGKQEVSDPQTLSKLLESLKFRQMFERRQEVKPALLHTCSWLFRHKEYQVWIDDMKLKEHRGFLWIKGKPGSGKSTLMKVALDKVGNHLPGYFPLSHFFNARAQEPLANTVLGLYRSVVYQIVSTVPLVQEQFLSTFVMKAGIDCPVEDWIESELQSFLIELVSQPAQVSIPLKLCLFIDGLDEADRHNVRSMLAFLEQLSLCAIESENHHLVRVCLSSRHYPHITLKRGLSLAMDDESDHEKDLERYIENRLNIEDASDSEALSASIRKKAQHVFLWVVLTVSSLNDMHDTGCTFRQLMSHVQNLPDELFGHFEALLLTTSANLKSTVSLFQWVLFSRRPLTPLEVYAAIQYETGSPRVLPEDEVPLGVLRKFLLDRSRGLVEITQIGEEASLQFIHETVREFLLDERGLRRLDKYLETNQTGLSHEKLKKRCRHELESVHFKLEAVLGNSVGKRRSEVLKVRKEYPLLQYSAQYFFHHVNQAQVFGLDQKQFMMSINERNSTLYWRWLRAYCLGPNGSRESYNESLTLLYMLISDISHGFDEIVEILVNAEVDLNAFGGIYGNPLQAAAARGKKSILRCLRDAGANVDATGGIYENALMAAMIAGDDEVFDLVRDCRAPTSTQQLQKRLGGCIMRQKHSRVTLLLEKGADVNTVCDSKNDFSTIACLPLMVAVKTGNLEMVNVLLDKGADINALSGWHGSALIVAVRAGDAEMTNHLIAKGADINAITGSDLPTPLLMAIGAGHEEIALELIQLKADVNAKCRPSRSDDWCDALQFALLQNQINVAHALIDAGADINGHSGPYHTPLQAAAAGGHISTVKLLLDRNADIHAQGGDYGNALQAALDEEHHEIAKILTGLGAQPARPASISDADEETTEGNDVQIESAGEES